MNQENQTSEQKISSSTKDALSNAIVELNKKITTKESEIDTLKNEKKSLTDFYEAQTGVRFKINNTASVTDVVDNGNGTQKVKRTYKKRKKTNSKKEAALSGSQPKGPKATRAKATKTKRVAEDSPITRATPIKPTKVPDEVTAGYDKGKGVKAKILWAMQQMGGKATRKELAVFLSKDLKGKRFNDNVYWAIRTNDITKSKDGNILHLQNWNFND